MTMTSSRTKNKLALTIVFFGFLLGVFVGRQSAALNFSLQQEVERELKTAHAADIEKLQNELKLCNSKAQQEESPPITPGPTPGPSLGPTPRPTPGPISSVLTRTSESLSAIGDTVHVLYALSGNHSGFLSEFTTSLKSLLMNAPLDNNMTVHILSDNRAHEAIGPILFKKINLDTFLLRNQVSIKTYNVEHHIDEWRQILVNSTGMRVSSRHTIGTFFRLFSPQVLPKDIRHIIYMDPDALILSNVQELWSLRDDSAMWQWGENRCAGFILINVDYMGKEFWKRIRQIDAHSPFVNATNQSLDDQFLLRKLGEHYPNSVSLLPEAWDNSWANGLWRFPTDKRVMQKRPEVGMLHLNGGGPSKQSAFKSHIILGNSDLKKTWQVPVIYYENFAWSWTKYFLGAQTRNGRSFPLSIDHKPDGSM